MDLKLKLFSLFFFLMSAQLLIAQQEKIWENTNFDFESDHISQFSQIQLNSALFLETLARAPKEFTAAARNNPLTIEFPMPDQSVLHFNVFESPIMAPSLAAKYPHFKTWCGQGVEDKTAIIRFDWTDKGLHAFIHSVNGTFLIDPVDLNNDYYISYNKKDLINTNYTGHFCNHEQTSLQNSIEQVGIQNRSVSVGEVLKTYRFAVATTGEYASFHGGTVPSVLSSIVTAVNRINQIFENEMSIRFELIPETESLIYLDSDTDPYTDGESLDMLIENIGNVPPIIGNDAFDVGHVFGTGGGGIANLGNICNDDEKAGGVTAVRYGFGL